MIITADITGSLVLVTLLGLGVAAYLIDRTRTERVVFTSGTAVAAPGLCSCGAPHAVSPAAPFPGDPVPLPAPVPPSRPEYVRTALDGHDDADGWVESRWRKIDGQMLAEQLQDGAP